MQKFLQGRRYATILRNAQPQLFGFKGFVQSAFITSFLLASSANAQQELPELRVVTFGTTVGFNEYLLRAAEDIGVSCSSSCFAEQNQANLVVIFASSVTDTRFMPQIISPVYHRLLQQDKSGSYFIKRDVFNGSFSADVAILTGDEFRREFLKAQKLETVGDDRISCVSALSVFHNWLKNQAEYELVTVRDQSLMDENLSKIRAFEKLNSMCEKL